MEKILHYGKGTETWKTQRKEVDGKEERRARDYKSRGEKDQRGLQIHKWRCSSGLTVPLPCCPAPAVLEREWAGVFRAGGRWEELTLARWAKGTEKESNLKTQVESNLGPKCQQVWLKQLSNQTNKQIGISAWVWGYSSGRINGEEGGRTRKKHFWCRRWTSGAGNDSRNRELVSSFLFKIYVFSEFGG